MSFFNPEIPFKVKPVSHHPWEKYIRDIYSSTYKYGHNSAKNPVYPPIKDKIPDDTSRVRFTIIGDRVVEDFIHSVNLVRGLYKYREKNFDSPIIRGVTSVEWPKIWNDLKIQYGGLTYCLESPVAVLIGEKFLGGFKELKQLIESKYVYHLTLNYYKEGVAQFARFIKSSGRPCAYMHISVDDEHIGTFLFMLYADLLPLTCENFLRLCRTKRGGYSGTPIHRIVKDCWIQCGGFGLKSTNLDCENFIVPHDRRGVLCMANNGRHVDCSTQFFVLLQPAPWMAFKYVAFGQLIDGEETLKKIESIPSWYETPSANIVIFEAGIFNMDCQDIMINRGANAYIESHIEDLNILGTILYEALLEKVFLEIEFRIVASLKEHAGEEEAHVESVEEEVTKSIRTTKRFMRKKEDIQQQISAQTGKKSTPDTRRGTSVVSTADAKRGTSAVSQSKSENNEFDVDEYHYEPEEYSYQQISPPVSAVVVPRRPYCIPLTDVPYPGEVDSTHDVKKFLRGDYCLESDLKRDTPKKMVRSSILQYPSEIFDIENNLESEDEGSDTSIDSEEAREIGRYLQNNLDRVSFAGDIIKSIAKTAGQVNLLEKARKLELITDETLRKLRMASMDYRHRRDKKVSISIPDSERQTHSKIKRRQTGFVRPADLEKIHIIRQTESDRTLEEEDDIATKKVRIAESVQEKKDYHSLRRPTAFVRGSSRDYSDMEVVRPSVLTRLYDEVHYDDDEDEGPTLKDYKPMSETHTKNSMFLTSSPQGRIRSSDNIIRESKFLRQSIAVVDDSYNQVLNIQHGKKIARKISSDYVKTIDQIEQRTETSLRSLEYARTRPTLSVTEYQIKNQKYQDEMKAAFSKTAMEPGLQTSDRRGIRLPGDTPTYSMTSFST